MALTPEQYIAKLRADREQIARSEQQLGRVVAQAHTRQATAIFDKGINARYSTRPTLAGGKVFPEKNWTWANTRGQRAYFGSRRRRASQRWVRILTPRGPRNLMVIEGGYRAIRAAEGKQTSRVNLQRTGQMFRDFAGSLTRVTAFAWVTGIRRRENVPKFDGSVSRYGEGIWKLPARERQRTVREMAAVMRKIRKILA